MCLVGDLGGLASGMTSAGASGEAGIFGCGAGGELLPEWMTADDGKNLVPHILAVDRGEAG